MEDASIAGALGSLVTLVSLVFLVRSARDPNVTGGLAVAYLAHGAGG